MFQNMKINWPSDLLRGDIIHREGLSPLMPFHSFRFMEMLKLGRALPSSSSLLTAEAQEVG